MYNKLPWDSKFFNLNVYSIYPTDQIANIDSDLEQLQKSKPCLVYIYLDPENQETLQQALDKDWTFVDLKVTFEKKIATNLPESPIEIEKFDKEKHLDLINDLYELAYLSGKHSRFNKDPRIPKEKFQQMYRNWIDGTIDLTFGEEIFLAIDAGILAGMATFKTIGNSGQIGLIAVDEQKQGKSYGSKLISAAENYAKQKGLETMIIHTQKDNANACAFYGNCGYRIVKEVSIFHVWY